MVDFKRPKKYYGDSRVLIVIILDSPGSAIV
jgi:hypothetical protein